MKHYLKIEAHNFDVNFTVISNPCTCVFSYQIKVIGRLSKTNITKLFLEIADN